MRKKIGTPVGAAFFAILVLLAAFLVRVGLHRPARVVLPEESGRESGGDALQGTGRDEIRRVEVTPDTVQRAIATLARPESYSRTVTVERYYSGGSGVSTAAVRTSRGWTRLDVTEENAEARHVITGNGRSYIWYGGEESYFAGAAALSADEEQSIPTYEDILLLERASIVAADYRLLDTLECIYVETAPDALGYVERFWVSVGNGLLAASEKVRGEEVVYRMAGLSVESGGVGAEAFTLPDGQVLFDPSAGNEQET